MFSALIYDSFDHSFHGNVGSMVSITVDYYCIPVNEWFIKQLAYTQCTKRIKVMQSAISINLHYSLARDLPNGQQTV